MTSLFKGVMILLALALVCSSKNIYEALAIGVISIPFLLV